MSTETGGRTRAGPAYTTGDSRDPSLAAAKGVLEASCTTSAPKWVPMGAAGNKFLAVARGEVDAALVGRGFGAPETEPTNFSVRLTD